MHRLGLGGSPGPHREVYLDGGLILGVTALTINHEVNRPVEVVLTLWVDGVEEVEPGVIKRPMSYESWIEDADL